MKKVALITGVTGQDGSYLAELLLEKGYKVYGIVRRHSSMMRERIDHLHDHPDFRLVYGDMADASSLSKIIRDVLPDEIYNLASQSHPQISFDVPVYTGDINGLGTTRILEVIRKIKQEGGKSIKFYQASTSEMYGKVQETPQTETTPFYPRSPYGCAKVYAYWITKNYRESFGLFTCNGILFNHESPRRGENFVTRKITVNVAKIKLGLIKCFSLGNLESKRDWGHAKDYVKVMWMMMQHDKPDDYVTSTGETHSVRKFLEEVFEIAGIPVKSNGKEGLEEQYIRTDTGETVVKIDPYYVRPAEVDLLLGDYSKAKKILGWEPKIKMHELAREMLEHDLMILGADPKKALETNAPKDTKGKKKKEDKK